MKNEDKKIPVEGTPTSGEEPQKPEEQPTPEVVENKGDGGSEGEGTDFKKKLENLEATTPPKKTEEEKARFTVSKIIERFPSIKEDLGVELGSFEEEDPTKKIEKTLLRNQAEGIIRQEVHKMGLKPTQIEDAVRYYVAHYDRASKTGNIYEDVDNAMWIANKDRTRNALQEMKRSPNQPPEPPSGPGAKPPQDDVTELPADQIHRLQQMGLKRVAKDRWEGTKVGLRFNKQTRAWEDFKK